MVYEETRPQQKAEPRQDPELTNCFLYHIVTGQSAGIGWEFMDCAGNKRKYRKWTVYGMFSPVKMRSESQKQVFMAW